MVFNVLYVLASKKSVILLFVLDTIEVLEEKIVVCGGMEDHVVGGVGTPPYFLNNIFCMLGL